MLFIEMIEISSQLDHCLIYQFYFPDIWYCCWTGGCQRQRGFTSLGPKNYSSVSECWCSRFLPHVEGWPCIQCNHPSQSVINLKAVLTRTRDYISIAIEIHPKFIKNHIWIIGQILSTGRRLRRDTYGKGLIKHSILWKKNMELRGFLTLKVRCYSIPMNHLLQPKRSLKNVSCWQKKLMLNMKYLKLFSYHQLSGLKGVN